MLRVYRYRLHPTGAQEAVLQATLWRLRELYNAALQERRDAYQKCGVSISAFQQMARRKDVRAERDDIAAIHVHLLQDAITRLDRAFRAFFRRCKAGEKPGYPRFRGRDRYSTFTFKDAGKRNGVRFVAGGRRLYLHGVGNVRIRMHRPMQGTLKQVSITLSGGQCAGREFIKVDPHGTSQECVCGATVRKTLRERTHDCPECVLVLGRDHCSAVIIERRGRRRRGGLSNGRPEEPRSPLLAR